MTERAVAQADQDAEAATVAERDAEDAVQRLEAELADARQRLAQARRQAYQAESRQRRAASELGRLRE
jgi:predicted  nucleic acid-binding Zn-ribbon protein